MSHIRKNYFYQHWLLLVMYFSILNDRILKFLLSNCVDGLRIIISVTKIYCNFSNLSNGGTVSLQYFAVSPAILYNITDQFKPNLFLYVDELMKRNFRNPFYNFPENNFILCPSHMEKYKTKQICSKQYICCNHKVQIY